MNEWKAQRAEERFLKDRGVPPRRTWVLRIPEEEPRFILGAVQVSSGWQVKGRDVVKALRKATGSTLFLGCVVRTTRLRQYFKLMSRDTLLIKRGDRCFTIREGRHHTTFLHGAWDKYIGRNGHDCELVFKEG